MNIRLWGTRGSIAAAGPDTVRYGGDTSSVEVVSRTGDRLILDAGSGIRALGVELSGIDKIDILLSHLHMDHVQGLPFFVPMLDPASEVHIWGPVSTTQGLRERLSRYLSPPLFPIMVRDLANVYFHDVPPGEFDINGIHVHADLVSHPGSTLGYRLADSGSSLSYLPDHEPAMGDPAFPGSPEWTSGYALAAGSDLLIHDAQYTDDEYLERVGWGHTSTTQLARFAEMGGVGRVLTFHHDPAHTDEALDLQHSYLESIIDGVEVVRGTADLVVEF